MVGVTTTQGLCVKGSEYQEAEHHGSSGWPYTLHTLQPMWTQWIENHKEAEREHKKLGEESEEQRNSWREEMGVGLNKTHYVHVCHLKQHKGKRHLHYRACVISSVESPSTPHGLTLSLPLTPPASSELRCKNLKSVTLCCALWPMLLFVIYSFEVGLGLRLKLRVTHMADRGSNTELHSQSIIQS